MKNRIVLFALMALACACSKTDSSPREEEFGIFPALQNGRFGDPAEYPASIWIGNCSATVIGERVVQTASHCVKNGGTIRFSVLSGQYTARCEQHSQYRGNATADWSYCLTDRVVQGIPYESIETDITALKVGMLITLSGYGCTKWNGPLDGRYRIGESQIIRMPNEQRSDYDIVTNGKAAVCSGDSGGPAFLMKDDGTRKVVTANSRRDTSSLESFLPFTAVSTNVAFMKNWAGRNGVEICGVHANAKGCRNVPLAPPVLDFTIVGKTLKLVGNLLPSAKYTAEEARQEFKAVVDRLDAK